MRIAAMAPLRQYCSNTVLQQYCGNAAAIAVLQQHCGNAHCKVLLQYCGNRGHCGNAFWYCSNTPIFSRCAGDNRRSTHCSAILHPFLMSNSHPLDLLFMPFEPIVCPLMPVVQGTVPLLFPMVSEAIPSNWSLHILCTPKTPAYHFQECKEAIAAGYKHSDSKSNSIV